jgi:hypothetical protein
MIGRNGRDLFEASNPTFIWEKIGESKERLVRKTAVTSEIRKECGLNRSVKTILLHHHGL